MRTAENNFSEKERILVIYQHVIRTTNSTPMLVFTFVIVL